MQKTSRVMMAVAVFILSSLACRTVQKFTSGEFADDLTETVEAASALPTLTPLTVLIEPDQQPTTVLLPTEAPPEPGLFIIDDFSDRNSGWKVEYADNLLMDYYQEGYRISINKSGTVAWSTVGVDYADVRLVVDARLIGGEEDNYLGVVCRHQDIDNFYTAVISSDGYFAIQKRFEGGGLEVISGEYFQESIVINQHMELNLIEVFCVGSQIKLIVNGQQIAEVTDTSIPSGDVGLIVGTLSAESTDVLFDNFTFYLEE